VLFAPLATWLIDSYGVLASCKILGAVHLLLIPMLALLVKAAPPGYVPANGTPPTHTHSSAAVHKDWCGMLSDPKFYILWCVYSLGTISGLMIIAHASPFSQEVIGLSSQMAAIAVCILALANTSGRIFWGWVSDHTGWFSTVVVMFVSGGIAMLALPAVSGWFAFLIVLIVVGLCFGGFMGIFPSIIAEAFGTQNLGMNYGVVFTAFGFSAIVGPRLAATVKEVHNGDYTYAFLIAAVLNLLGIILTLSLIFINAAAEKKETSHSSLPRKAL
jgi:MFS transporter, OFA family, oxalate/formate antiporter